jgi:acetylornithine deacetylase/succinyl-diaminopimelate desuccinylase-like protein
MRDLNHHLLDTYVADSKKLLEHFLGSLIEIPTVSMDRSHFQDMQRGANLAVSYLTEIGARTEVIETSGHPVVLAYLENDPKMPTVTLYHHLDVQPALAHEWESPPFQFTIKDDVYYLGRGATDDKGPAVTALLAAKFAMEEHIPINIKFIWEMEEEIGSPNFEAAVRPKKQALETDSILVSDTLWISRNKPAIPHGLRGLMTAYLTLTTGQRDTHSGSTGGATRNPLGELCQLIDRCYDPFSGKVRIEGFYDQVQKPSPKELEEYGKSGFNIDEFREIHGLGSLRTKDPHQAFQAICCEPTFEVHGITGGYMGEGVKTIIPHTAQAKISTRLVPKQNPLEIFQLLRDFVKRENPEVEVTLDATLNPYLTELTGFHMKAAREAINKGFGLDPVFIREGGSIGPVVTMQNIWPVPIVLLGFSLPEHGSHSPHESFDWFQAAGGMKTLVHYFHRASQV